MLKVGLKLLPSCPNCQGLLYVNDDGYEKYLTCLGCSREYNEDLTSKRMTPYQLESRYGIKFSEQGERSRTV